MNRDTSTSANTNAASVPSEVEARPARWLLRIVVRMTIVTILLIVVLPVLIGALGIYAVISVPCSDGGSTPRDFGLPYMDISVPARWGGSYRGFFVPGNPSTDRATGTIIVPPAYNGGRAGMLFETAPLAEAGYNLLLYESRVCAGHGPLSLGYRDVEDVQDALAFLRDNPHEIQVNQNRIALHGFSSAGAASLMATARTPQISAVLAEGGYHTLGQYVGIGRSSNLLESLMHFGIQLGYRLGAGDDFTVLDTMAVIDQIPPRPVLLVYGSDEVSLSGGQTQLEALRAHSPETMAALWVVPGADHGGYIGAVGHEVYARHTLAFYDCALLEQCTEWELLFD